MSQPDKNNNFTSLALIKKYYQPPYLGETLSEFMSLQSNWNNIFLDLKILNPSANQ
jgi:hypothetical protein